MSNFVKILYYAKISQIITITAFTHNCFSLFAGAFQERTRTVFFHSKRSMDNGCQRKLFAVNSGQLPVLHCGGY